jgi:hypothetical protein
VSVAGASAKAVTKHRGSVAVSGATSELTYGNEVRVGRESGHRPPAESRLPVECSTGSHALGGVVAVSLVPSDTCASAGSAEVVVAESWSEWARASFAEWRRTASPTMRLRSRSQAQADRRHRHRRRGAIGSVVNLRKRQACPYWYQLHCLHGRSHTSPAVASVDPGSGAPSRRLRARRRCRVSEYSPTQPLRSRVTTFRRRARTSHVAGPRCYGNAIVAWSPSVGAFVQAVTNAVGALDGNVTHGPDRRSRPCVRVSSQPTRIRNGRPQSGRQVPAPRRTS